MYEDAGNDKDYAESYATTEISSHWIGNQQTITICPRQGSYNSMPAQRKFKVKVVASTAPASVTVNGEEAVYEYDGKDLSFTVEIPQTDCSAEKTVCITYPSEKTALAQGIIGLSRRMGRSIEALKYRTGADPIDALAMLGSINEAVLYNPEQAECLASEFMASYTRLPEILKQQPRLSEEDIQWFLVHCGWSL